VHVRLSVYVIAILVGLPIGGVVVPSSAFEPGWGTAVSLKIGGGDALYPQVAVDPRGNAIVLWFQYDENPSDGADGNLWAARFTPLEGWGAPVIVSRLNALTADGQSGWYRVATDSRGNTFAIWVDHERATHLSTVLASRFVPEAGWGPSESFDESDVGGAGVGGPPQIAFDGQGNAIAVWTKGSDTAASRYVLDVGWDQATQVGVPYEGGTCDIGFGDAGGRTEPQGALDRVPKGQQGLRVALELYFYNECGFSRSVLNCMTNLHCEDRIIKKNIRENSEYEKELVALTGAKTVPVLVIDGKALCGSEEINKYLVVEFV